MHAVDSFGAFLRGAAIGAAAMYLFDPDKGRRRRAIARDKLSSFACESGELLTAAAHDIGNRVRGAEARAARVFTPSQTPDDLRLIERVRARIGRAVSNPHAIQVGVRDGRVTLSGPVLESEAAELLNAALDVPGVRGVDDHLVAHAGAGSIPGLQGTPRPQRDRTPALLDADAPTMRAATLVAGLALAAYGATRGSLGGLALAGIGASVAARGARRPLHRQRRAAHADAVRDVETASHAEQV
jgi:hypothetical protein